VIKKIGREMDIQYTKFESEMNILNTKIGSKIDIQYTHDSVLAGTNITYLLALMQLHLNPSFKGNQ
jgi:hypothetical protein